MEAQGYGQIVINTSASGKRAAPIATMYSACRAGANMLIRCAALSAAPKGIAINHGSTKLTFPFQRGDQLDSTRPRPVSLPFWFVLLRVCCKFVKFFF